jgi:hypothetical protein
VARSPPRADGSGPVLRSSPVKARPPPAAKATGAAAPKKVNAELKALGVYDTMAGIGGVGGSSPRSHVVKRDSSAPKLVGKKTGVSYATAPDGSRVALAPKRKLTDAEIAMVVHAQQEAAAELAILRPVLKSHCETEGLAKPPTQEKGAEKAPLSLPTLAAEKSNERAARYTGIGKDRVKAITRIYQTKGGRLPTAADLAGGESGGAGERRGKAGGSAALLSRDDIVAIRQYVHGRTSKGLSTYIRHVIGYSYTIREVKLSRQDVKRWRPRMGLLWGRVRKRETCKERESTLLHRYRYGKWMRANQIRADTDKKKYIEAHGDETYAHENDGGRFSLTLDCDPYVTRPKSSKGERLCVMVRLSFCGVLLHATEVRC